MSDLDAISQAIEERNDALERLHMMASEMVYQGNSVQHWYNKAKAYQSALQKAWDALQANGIHPDGEMDVAAGIQKLANAR